MKLLDSFLRATHARMKSHPPGFDRAQRIFLFAFPFFLFFLHPFSGSSQSDTYQFCGSYAADPPFSNNPDSLVFDRFGNSFDIRKLLLSNGNGSGNKMMSGGYFHTTELGDPPPDVMDVVNQALIDISHTVLQRTSQTDCGDLAPQNVELQVVWIDFSSPDPALMSQLGLSTLPAAGAGIGTPFYSGPTDQQCREVALERPFIKINGGRPNGQGIFDGRLLLNSHLPSTNSCPDLTWNLDATSQNFPCQMDLYTVVLHELMHVMGYASRLGFTDAYSLWDQSLRVVDEYEPGGGGANPAHVITSDCISNCWTPISNLNALAAHTCDDHVNSPDIVVGDQAWAPVAGNPNVDVNDANALNGVFSHLSQYCSGQDVHYVMRPGLDPGDYQRVMTDPELNIFCTLGYQVQSPTVSCDGCFNIAHEDRNYHDETACCFKTYFICRGQTISIPSSDLLCNDITNQDLQVITRVWPHGGSFSGVTVTPSTSVDGWDILVNTTNSSQVFDYTVVGCDCRMHNGTFTLFIDQQCPNCTFTPDICDNMLCDGDFEDFTNTSTMESHFNYPLFFEGADVAGSPDIIVSSGGNHYVHVGNYQNREAVNLPLQNCVSPGCNLTLELDLSGYSTTSSLEIWGSHNRPCPATVLGAAPLNNNCGGTTSCVPPEDFSPVCIANFPTNVFIGTEQAPHFEHIQNYVWPNNTDQEVCFLTFVPGGPGSNVYFDNVVATMTCEPTVTCNGADIDICAGTQQPATLNWEVCAPDLPGAGSTNITVHLSLPSGITAVNPSQLAQTFTLAEGACTNITLDVLSSLPAGTVVEATMTGQASGVCTSIQFSCTLAIHIITCDPPACTCTVPGSINVDAGTGTAVANTAIHPATTMAPNGYRRLQVPCLSISGNLLINNNYRLEIDADEIIMAPGAEITVVTYSQLDILNTNQNGGMHGCNIMWRGITVEPKARLLLNNNIIQDAQYAVTSFRDENGLPKLKINNTQFNRNHVGIRITDPLGVYNNIPQEGIFSGNRFMCTSTMLPTFDFIGNYLPNAPFAGIELHNAHFNVGGTGNTQINNFFDHLRNGIAAEKSDVQVFGARITNMLNGGPLVFNGITYYEYEPVTFDGAAGIGIFNIKGRDTHVEYSNFDHLYKGINSTFSHVNFLHNSVQDVTIGFEVGNTNNRTVSMTHNQIEFKQNGIRNSFCDTPTSLTINENENISLIAGNSDPDAPANKSAIESFGAVGSLLPEGASISYNTINLNGYANGISFQGHGNMDVFTNHVNFMGLTDGIYNFGYVGLTAFNTRLNYFNGNDIHSDSNTKHTWGITSADNESSIYCCNLTQNTYVGFHNNGWCDQSLIRGTTLDNIYSGLSCQNGTVIGPQVHAGNIWNQSYQFYGAYHGGGQGEIDNSQFFVEPPEVAPLWPEQRNPASGWFIDDTNGNAVDNCAADASCPTVPTPPEFGPGEGGVIRTTDIALVNGAFNDAKYADMLNFEGGRSLYRRIQEHHEMLGQDGKIDAFYQNCTESGLSHLFDVDGLVAKMESYAPAIRASVMAIETDIRNAYGTVATIQTQLASNPELPDYNQLITNLQSQSDFIAQKMADLNQLTEGHWQRQIASGQQALEVLLQLPDNLNHPADNRRIVDRIFLETIAQGIYELTSDQRDQLFNVATQCPSSGGDAVYAARELYGLGLGSTYFDDSQLCNSENRSSMTGTGILQTSRMKLAPNPALDAVQVFLPAEMVGKNLELTMVDMTGKIWLKQHYEAVHQSIMVQLAELPAGVYACRIAGENGKAEARTLIVQR